MLIKQVFLLILSLFLIMSFNNKSYAERNLLNPPALLSFNSEEYLDEDYKQSLKQLRIYFEEKRDDRLLNIVSRLYKTTRKDSSKKLIKELSSEMEKYEKKGIHLYNEIDTNIKKIVRKIEDGSFNKHRTGVDFRIDEKNREYIVSWKENGKEVIKRTPFVPEMKLIVKGDYIPKMKDNKKIMVYQYWVENKKGSKASFLELYIENKFPQDYILKKIKSKYGRMSLIFEKSKSTKQRVSYPGGYLNYFIFWNFNSIDEMLIKYYPKQQMDYPYELEEIERGLPGILECYVPAAGFNPHAVISAEADPEIASDFIATKPNTRTMYMYSGITIGPVPIPEPFDKTKFIEQIISYNSQSIEEGWNDKQEVIKFTQEGMEKIKNEPGNKEQIKDFLSKLEEYYKKKMILSEAYALLRYNLEYLLSKM